jgi:hypothetical protein
MGQLWRHLPPQARTVATTASDAVAAVAVRDGPQFEGATAQLARSNPALVRIVLGAVVRMLLEELHPNGLSGADVRAVLERCARSAVGWSPDVDPDVLLALLTGALGIHPPGESARPISALDVARHAPLLAADLVVLSGLPFADFLDAAFAEIARAEGMELP